MLVIKLRALARGSGQRSLLHTNPRDTRGTGAVGEQEGAPKCKRPQGEMGAGGEEKTKPQRKEKRPR